MSVAAKKRALSEVKQSDSNKNDEEEEEEEEVEQRGQYWSSEEDRDDSESSSSNNETNKKTVRKEITLPGRVSGLEFPYLWFSGGRVRGWKANISPIERRLSARIFADFANVHLQQLTDCVVLFNVPRGLDECDINRLCLTNTQASLAENKSLISSAPLSGVEVREIVMISRPFGRAFIRLGSAQQASLTARNLDAAKLTLSEDGFELMAKRNDGISKNDDNDSDNGDDPETSEFSEICELTASLIQFEPTLIEVERSFSQFRQSVETVDRMHWKKSDDFAHDRCIAAGGDAKKMRSERFQKREERRKRRKVERKDQSGIYLANGTLVTSKKTALKSAPKSVKRPPRKIFDRVTAAPK